MKIIMLVLLTCLVTACSAQKATVKYNKLVNIEGTPFTVGTSDTYGKLAQHSSSLVFINTNNGEVVSSDFPEGASIDSVCQLRNDSLSIHMVLVFAATKDIDGKKGIGWGDPRQLFIFAPNGTLLKQVTEDHYFISSWTVNPVTGRLVLAGFHDRNTNSRHDHDEGAILVVDLRSMSVL